MYSTKHSVEPVDPEGQPFDADLHQAVSMVPNAEVEPNTVINVFQKGYTLEWSPNQAGYGCGIYLSLIKNLFLTLELFKSAPTLRVRD
jgi:hypothetical protein